MAGFDFQIDPYRHGGRPGSITSVPYPVVAEEAFAARVEPAVDIELVQLVESMEAVSVAISGTLRDILLRIDSEEALDAFHAGALEGVLRQILHVVDMEPDEFDSLGSRALSGVIARILIVIWEEEDSFDSIMARATGGTLT